MTELKRGRPSNAELAARANVMERHISERPTDEAEAVALTQVAAIPRDEPQLYKPMDTAPKDRPITLGPMNVVAIWRQSRKYAKGSWRRYEGWTHWLTKQSITFEPTGWRE